MHEINSKRYEAQAEEVLRMARRAASPAEKQVYLDIAEGWRKLALEAARHEDQEASARPPQVRSFRPII